MRKKTQSMKTMNLTGLKQIKAGSSMKPEIGKNNEVLVKLNTVGVCGSDVHYYAAGNIGDQVVDFPFRPGHECAGTVESTGEAVARLKPGDRVVIDPLIPCDPGDDACDQCAAGRENTCRKQRFLGCPGQAEGCLCEYIVMPETSCYRIPGAIPFDRAVLAEPLSIGCYTIRQSIPMEGATVAVFGSGPIGLSTIIPACLKGAEKIYATDKLDYRLDAAILAGAEWTGNPDKLEVAPEILSREPTGVDVVFECCGQQEAIDQAVEILKPGGRLILVGIPRENRISFNISSIRRKELAIINVRRQNGCMEEAIGLLENPDVNIDFMITHRFGFEDTGKAFELVDSYSDNVIKAVIHAGGVK